MSGHPDDFLTVVKGEAPSKSPHESEVRIYADENGALRSIQSDGTDAAVGGGGSGGSVVRGPFSFTFDTPGLNDGVPVYTPTVDDILLDAWFEIVESFNGTTPKADIAQTVNAGQTGLFASLATGHPVPLDNADTSDNGPVNNGALDTRNLAGFNFNGDGVGYRVVPARFATADPLLLFVSDDGTKGGTPVGGDTGEAHLYLVTASPVAL